MLESKGKTRQPWRDWLVQFGMALLAVALALLVGAVIILLMGASPVAAYRAILYGAFGNINNLSETVVKAAPLVLAGAGLAVAYRANMWNIGAEGQIYVGGLAAICVGLYLGHLPAVIVLPLAALAGFAGGALWAGIAGILKVRLGIDEVINTIMLNYIAILGVNWLIHGPLKDPAAGFPRTAMIPINAQLPILIPRTRLHLGVVMAIVLAILLQWILWRTSLGYRIRAVGQNRTAARYGGINVGRAMMIAMFISGGMAGLAGMNQATGLHFRMLQDISGGIGFHGDRRRAAGRQPTDRDAALRLHPGRAGRGRQRHADSRGRADRGREDHPGARHSVRGGPGVLQPAHPGPTPFTGRTGGARSKTAGGTGRLRLRFRLRLASLNLATLVLSLLLGPVRYPNHVGDRADLDISDRAAAGHLAHDDAAAAWRRSASSTANGQAYSTSAWKASCSSVR